MRVPEIPEPLLDVAEVMLTQPYLHFNGRYQATTCLWIAMRGMKAKA